MRDIIQRSEEINSSAAEDLGGSLASSEHNRKPYPSDKDMEETC
jgi:hypothetical protein